MTNLSPKSPLEKARLSSVYQYDVLDTQYEKDLDDLTSFAASIFHVPIVLITIIDEKRQWFKSNYGLSIKETERSISFCQYTIMKNEIFEVENAYKDERFAHNPLVTDNPNIRFYCGAPLINEDNFAMGSLAIIDTKPRKLSENERDILLLLTRQVLNFFELTRKNKELEKDKVLLENRIRERTLELEFKVNELEKRDKKLISLNNELSRFIYKLSHDLLGPLKSIQGLANLAITESNEANIVEYLQLQQRSAQKLDNTLVSLIKLISVKDLSDISKIDWKSVIQKAMQKAEQRAAESNARLAIEIISEEDFYCDRLMLETMLEEFLVNSLQYNLQVLPYIKAKVTDVKDHILLEITDNGIGIREEEKESIFEMFYKNEKSKGSGLGLYIVKNIVEKMHGRINLESHKNEGTTFQILFPLKK